MTIKGGQGALANATIDGAYDFDNQLLETAQPAQQSATTVTYEMFDFGKKVDIKVPASSDVVDIADLRE
ncbi:MAG: hypothetical protein Q8K63_04420 [Acidimicrobiales bacterium]|nr:hypothetical protein [Acidimicrobiales bacterium]